MRHGDYKSATARPSLVSPHAVAVLKATYVFAVGMYSCRLHFHTQGCTDYWIPELQVHEPPLVFNIARDPGEAFLLCVRRASTYKRLARCRCSCRCLMCFFACGRLFGAMVYCRNATEHGNIIASAKQ
eukprot:SAG31_NODE_4548_length_3149_cov_1.504918_4_plen_128_part_00